MQLLREAEEVSAEHAVSRALTLARTLAELDARFAPMAKLIDESLIALREGVEAVERYESDLEADPQRQEWVEQRLAAMESIARKHRVEVAELLGTAQRSSQQNSSAWTRSKRRWRRSKRQLAEAQGAVSRRLRTS